MSTKDWDRLEPWQKFVVTCGFKADDFDEQEGGAQIARQAAEVIEGLEREIKGLTETIDDMVKDSAGESL